MQEKTLCVNKSYIWVRNWRQDIVLLVVMLLDTYEGGVRNMGNLALLIGKFVLDEIVLTYWSCS